MEKELNLRVAREESLRQSVESTERIKWEHELADQLATVKEDLTKRLKMVRHKSYFKINVLLGAHRSDQSAGSRQGERN